MEKRNSTEAEITVSIDGIQVWKNSCPLEIEQSLGTGRNNADSIVLRHPAGSFPHVIFGFIVIIPSLSKQSLMEIADEAAFDPFLYPAVDESLFTFEALPPVPSAGSSFVTDALKQLPSEGGCIDIPSGTYAGPLSISPKNLSLIGCDPLNTCITGYEAMTHGIRRNVLVKVVGGDSKESNDSINRSFRAENICFWNKGSRWNASIGYDERRGAAFCMEDFCDVRFRNCRFLGEQDTLYLKSGIARFDECYIEGDIDFICGGATVLFSNCHLHILNHVPVFITAASPVNECVSPEHPLYEELKEKVQVEGFPGLQGFIFHRCFISMDAELKTPVHLGRGPWKNGSGLSAEIKDSVLSSVSFIDCDFGSEAEPFLIDLNELWCPMDAPMGNELYRTYSCRINGKEL
jgi:hypothetical protein